MVLRRKEGRRRNSSQELEEAYPSDWKVLSSRDQALEGKNCTYLLGFRILVEGLLPISKFY